MRQYFEISKIPGSSYVLVLVEQYEYNEHRAQDSGRTCPVRPVDSVLLTIKR